MAWSGGTLHYVFVILGLGIHIAFIDMTSAAMDIVYPVPEAPVVKIFSKTADQIVFALESRGDYPGAPVLSFRVEFRPVTSSIDDVLTQEVPKTSTLASSSHDPEYTFMRVHSLQESTHYAFAFYSRNSIGESRATELTIATPAATYTGFYAGSSKPKITTAPRDFRAIKSERAFFFCKADGEPTPATFSWETADGRLLRRKKLFSVVDFPGGSSLLITNAKTKLDGKAFTCVAKNKAGEARASATLYVYKIEPPTGFPVITEGPALKAVAKGQNGTLNCQTNIESTDNSSRIYWLKDSVPVTPSFPMITQTNYEKEQLKGSTLSINIARDSDQGKYECVAENDIGSVISYPANLYVKVRRIPPYLVTAPADIVDVEMNGEINITCSARGSPMPTIRWLRGIMDVTPMNTTDGLSILQLKDVKESAHYTCVVTSELGRLDKEVYVSVHSGIVSAPKDVRVRPASATSVVVEWDEAETSNIMITGYTVLYTHHPDYPIRLWLSQDVNSSNTRMATIDGLEPNKTYTFSVRTYSKESFGPMSDPVQVVLVFRITEPLQPRHVVAKPVSPSEIEVSWDPPLDNDQMVSYTIYISEYYSQQKDHIEINPAFTEYKLKGLTPDTAYEIVMSGNNKFGQSARSVVVQARTPEFIPEEPQRVRVHAVNSTTLHVEWRRTNPHGVIKGYYIYYVKLNAEGEPIYTTERTFHVAGPDTNEADIGGLDPDTTYSVTIAAYTRRGDGIRSKAKTVFITEADGMLEPGFLPTPTNITAEVGQSVVLPCHIKNLGNNTVWWVLVRYRTVPISVGESMFPLFEDRMSLEVTNQSEHESHWDLVIRDVQLFNARTYICQVGTSKYKASRYVTLEVKGIKITGSEYVYESGTIQLACSATGTSDTAYGIDWFFNGLKIRPSQARWQARTDITYEMQRPTINSTLIITNATDEDGGNYMCRSTDRQVVSRMVNVTRDGMLEPGFLPTPTNIHAVAGWLVVLPCHIKNLGNNTVGWGLVGHRTIPITVGDTMFPWFEDRMSLEVIQTSEHEMHWNLKIRNVQLFNARTYVCQIGTSKHKASRYVTLEVLDNTQEPFEQVQEGINITGSENVYESGTIQLECLATGTSEAPYGIDWFFQGLKIRPSQARWQARTEITYDMQRQTINSTLIITKATKDDEGNYVCRSTDGQVVIWMVNVTKGGAAGVPANMLQPSFLSTPTNVTAEVGQTVELPCHIKNLGGKMVIWRLDGGGVPISVGASMFRPVETMSIEVAHQSEHESHWDLVIRDVQLFNARTYICQVGASKYNTSRYVTLEVIDSQEFTDQVQKGINITGSDYVYESGTIQLECLATGTSEAPYGIDWFFNGLKIRPSQARWQARTEITYEMQRPTINSTLIITKATEEDGGNYVCRSTDGQIISRMVNVTKGLTDGDCVQELAKYSNFQQCFMEFATFVQQEMARSQDIMGILCSAEGKRKMACVSKYAEQCPKIISVGGGMDLASFYQMGGIEAACAILGGASSSGFPSENKDANTERNTDTQESPEQVQKGINITGSDYVNESGTIQLECLATGTSEAPYDIDWFFNGLKIRPSQARWQARTDITYDMQRQTINSTLIITNATKDDEGNYVCRSTDGQIVSRMVNVTKGSADDDCVKELNRDSGFHQCFINYSTFLQHEMSRSQDMMSIICSTEGKRKMACVLKYIEHCPESIGRGDGMDLASINQMGGIEAACAIIGGAGTGGYTGGNKAPDSMPRDLTIVPLENDPFSVTFSWQPPGIPNGIITGYLVFFTTNVSLDVHSWIVEGVIGERMSLNITDLAENTTYYFKVQARNNNGYGPLSHTWTYSTPPRSADSDCVQELNRDSGYRQCFINYSTFLQHEMARSQDLMGIICSTESMQKMVCVFDYAKQCPAIMNQTGTGIPVIDKIPFTQMDDLEAACAYRTKAKDAMPRNLTIAPIENNPLAVSISWQPPENPLGNITGYEVFYTMGQILDDHFRILEYVSGDILSVNTTDLDENSTYNFYVRVVETFGYGPVSSVMIYDTPPIFPYPRNISVTATGHGISITWEPWPTNLPPTMFYTVHVASEIHSGDYRVPSEATNFTLGLLSGTTYQIQISTTMGDDEKDRSPAIVVKTRDIAYACEDRGVGGYSCTNLEKAFGSTKKMCKKAFHECCDTCSSSRRTCKREKHVVMEGKVHDCSSLVQHFGKTTTCTIFTKECCVTCREEEEFVIESIEMF